MEPKDKDEVSKLLGREPQGEFEVVLRSASGEPQVIKNAPVLFDGRPMPTLFWLVDPEANKLVSRLESAGGVKRAEAEVDPMILRRAHQQYQKERDELIPPNHSGAFPSGGVGGTKKGVKCLHAHYAYFLVGGDDPIGAWVAEKMLAEKL